MTERIAISEAPEAVLGAPGTTQNLPIAELNREGLVVPKRTTIEAMMAFFGGGGGGLSPQIQMFSNSGAASQFFSQISDLAVDETSNVVNLDMRATAGSVLAGDAGAYGYQNGLLRIRDAGVYALTWTFWASYRNTGAAGDWRWVIEMRNPLEGMQAEVVGRFIEPFPHLATVRIGLGQMTFITRSQANNAAIWQCFLRNVGAVSSPNPRRERIQLVGDDGNNQKRSQLLIVKLAD